MGRPTGTDAAGETGERQDWCPGCGSQIRPGTRFCTRCGFELGPDQRPQRPGTATEVRRAWPTRILIGAIVAAGLLVGIIFVTHPFGHGHPAAEASPGRSAVAFPPKASSSPSVSASASASSITERQAAANLAALLSQSGNERQAVSAAFNDADRCGSRLGQDVQTFQGAATAHQHLLNELAQMPGLAVLPAAMKQDLRAAWQASASADSDYALWAQDQLANGCTASSQSDSGYLAADGPNQRATANKLAFVRQWNPVARTYDLPTYTQGDL